MPPAAPARENLFTCSAVELARMIAQGEVRSIELVDETIRFIQRVNPALNAVVCDRFDAARREALAADRAIAESEPSTLPPLFGVPCTIKECFAVAGYPQTGGLVARRDHIAQEDATVVARLREAGAIVVGLTNVSELCMWMETSNAVYGRTNNPYDPSRIVGGSSGGEGSIVGAGASPFGIGSDIGGSIRMPAFFNGVFGHKPTGGLVPGTGQYPMAENEALSYLTTGPIARRASDLMPILRLIAGPDGQDTATRPFELRDPRKVSVDRLRVLTVESNGLRSVSSSLLGAQRAVAGRLEEAGAQVAPTRFSGLRRSLDIWSQAMGAAADTPFRVLLGDGAPLPLGRNFARWLTRRSQHTLPALALAVLEGLPMLNPDDHGPALRKADALRDEIADALGDDGVMLYPSYTRPAPRHRTPILTPIDWVYTAIINVLGFPATQVPLGLNAAGLPLGVQVVGPIGRDDLTIGVALWLEEQFGGWVPPWEAHAARRAAS